MTLPEDHLAWPNTLEALVEGSSCFTRIVVLTETESTQDALARLDPEPGVVLVAARQNRGRGRQGRQWADDEGLGVAISFAVAPASAALLCARAAVATSIAYGPLLAGHGVRSGVKWPNDFLALLDRPRKLAGILIEQVDARAIIGVGVNVRSRRWPPELADSAGSLEDAGVLIPRLEAITRFLGAWEEVMTLSHARLITAFQDADLLLGCQARFRENGVSHEGVVTEIDPFTGVTLRTDSGTVLMRPDLARLEHWEVMR